MENKNSTTREYRVSYTRKILQGSRSYFSLQQRLTVFSLCTKKQIRVSGARNLKKKKSLVMALGYKKNEIMPFTTTWMDLEILILSEVSQTEKDKYHDVTYT